MPGPTVSEKQAQSFSEERQNARSGSLPKTVRQSTFSILQSAAESRKNDGERRNRVRDALPTKNGNYSNRLSAPHLNPFFFLRGFVHRFHHGYSGGGFARSDQW